MLSGVRTRLDGCAAALAALAIAVACNDRSASAGGDSTGNTQTGSDDGTGAGSLDDFFGLTIHTVDITVSDAGVQALLEQPRVYVEGAVEIDGRTHSRVGVRLKGGAGSFVPLDGDYPEISGDGNGKPGKSAFIVDINRFVPGADHLGLEKITINNMVQDSSGIHEYLGYTLFRAGGVPASRSGFAIVSFNGEDKGLYALIETPDNDEFLEAWFETDRGNLYEGEYGADFYLEWVDTFDQDNGTDLSRDDLRMLATALDAIQDPSDVVPVLEQHFDLDAYATFAATEIYLGHWDGYAQSANNYAVHHNPNTGLWAFLPWGIDQLFVDEMGPFAGVMQGPGPSWHHGGRIHQLCMSSPECRGILYDAFRDLFARIDSLGLRSLAGEAREVVEALLLAESTEFGDPDLTTGSLDQVVEHIDRRQDEIESWLPCLVGGVVDNDGDGADGCAEDCDDFNENAYPGATETCNLFDDDCNGIVDDPPECPECIDFELPFGVLVDLCFRPRPWHEARGHCQQQGGELVSIHDPETAEALMWAPPDLLGVEEVWIGLSDVEVEGDFAWSDGSPLEFVAWLEGEPTPPPESEERDCVLSRPGGWVDIFCGEPLPFVCSR
jgi:spore coat protein CotH